MVQKKEIQGGGSFKSHKTYSPQEILAAGGTTIFGRQTKKNNASLVEVLAKTPAIEPFTDKEWENLQEQLDCNK